MNMNKYKGFLDNNKHEIFAFEDIKQRALGWGYTFYNFNSNKTFKPGDKIIFRFKRKLIALVEVGDDISQGANMIVSHIDSPRLDVMPNQPFETKEDGVFCKVVPYGGIVNQVWLDRPLVLVGQAFVNEELIRINTEEDKIFFTISSLLPHLGGRRETDNIKLEKMSVRMGEDILKHLEEKYGLTEENIRLAELSFVPAGKAYEIGFDKKLIASYGHDDRVCAFAEMEAMIKSKMTGKTKIALFTSYEETGSRQSSGAQSQLIDDIFLELAGGDERLKRQCMRHTRVISADVTAGFDSMYANHFESSCKAVCGKGTAIVPFLGNKSGNDSTIGMREFIRKLCADNGIKYQLETTKLGEGGGGTVSSFFNTKGMDIIDIGVPVLAMHSPQELIHKEDLKETYKLYKVFFESF